MLNANAVRLAALALNVTATNTVCDLCDGTMIVSRGTQAGSACACDPCWESHRAERAADIRAGHAGFTGGSDDALHLHA